MQAREVDLAARGFAAHRSLLNRVDFRLRIREKRKRGVHVIAG
jgi:hypothetical protein